MEKKKNKLFFTKNHNFLKFNQNSIVTLICTGLLKKKQLCEKLILKIMVKVSVYSLGQSSHVSAMANLKGIHTSVHVLKTKVEKGKIMKLLDSISELIFSIDYTRNLKIR